MPSIFKRFFSFFIFISIYSLIVPSIIMAQKPGDYQDMTNEERVEQEKAAKAQEEISGETQIFSTRVNNVQLGDTMYNLSNMVVCQDPDETNSICSQPTALGAVAGVIDLMYKYPPASSVLYAYDVMNNAGLVKTAHAQGIGFAGLSPLLPLWKITRNISYSVIVIIMVAIGFMIIFRMKIDPKTVISVQAALPKIVITLIIITFSYPIVGFFIDIMYVVMAILIKIIGQGIGFSPTKIAEVQQWYMAGGIGQLGWSIFSGGISSLDDFFLRPYFAPFNVTSGGVAVGLFYQFVTHNIWTALPFINLIPALILLILLLGMLFTFIRILMLLLNSYIQLLIALVVGPLQLLVEAIPGRSAFSGWILNIIANLVVFPTTAGLLMFAEYLTQSNASTPLWTPPLTGVPAREAFSAFLGLGVIFLSPTLIATVKKLFHPKPILPLTPGTLIAPLTGGAQTAMGAASQFYYLQHTPIISRFFGGQQGGAHPK